jgi:hypothetical protein
MKIRLRVAKWFLAAVPLLAPPLGTATLGPGIKVEPTLDLSLRNCDHYPYTVICDRNHTAGGRTGCFDTLCEAAAYGAFQCKRNASACEPH